ncbi:MAG: site-2 protease family protein [Verrucomicrobiales bacterium]|nr:site-2 protease family protein [Verrucomicrobiales bacterium]
MSWSFTIAKIAGTRVRIHLTFILLLAWLGTSFWVNGSPLEAIRGVAYIISIFLCVLLHEFGHAFAALKYGITTPSITLFPLGGLARLSRIPKEPEQELFIAAAGPLVNLMIASILLLFRFKALTWTLPTMGNVPGNYLDHLIWINLVLALFNLIPAFPMDGGRILRAILGYFMTREIATTIAARIGQSLAVAGCLVSILTGHPILLLISLFVFFAAKTEADLVRTEYLLMGITASDASLSEFHTLKLTDTIDEVVKQLLDTSQVDFPVVNDHGQCIAIVTQSQLFRTLREHGNNALVSDMIDTIPAQIEADAPLLDAWEKLRNSRLTAAAIVDGEGRLTRWLTMSNLTEFILTQSALHEFATHHGMNSQPMHDL